MSWPIERGGGEGPCGNKTLSARINRQVAALERPCAQQRHVSGFPEDHLVNREGSGDVHHRETDASSDAGTVGHDELELLFFPLDADLLENRFRNSGVLAPCIDQETRDRSALLAVSDVLDARGHVKCAHRQAPRAVGTLGDHTGL
jgi:hypothetical protein